MVVVIPVGVFLGLIVALTAAVAASDGGDDLVQIGELWNGRVEPKKWVPITRNKAAPQPYVPVSDSWKRSDTAVWAGIASFRDKRCGKTLFNMFSKAAHPERVTAGVVQQNEEGDPSCLESYCALMMEHDKTTQDCRFHDNIRVLEVNAADAQGPCWGRHLQSYLLADEEFCMQTDSHMDFLEGWDTSMLGEWAATRNEYGVLSTYVQDFPTLGKLNKKREIGHLCEIIFPASLQPRNQRARAIHEMTEPKMTTTWGAGYAFSKCHAERRVPYDPYLDQIFDGEEFSKMVRLWTNGYDVYTPSRSYVVHDYSHPDSSTTTSWTKNGKNDNKQGRKAISNQRLWNLMEMPQFTEEGRREVQEGAWGLGDRRTLDEFFTFTGVDLRSKEYIGITGDRCGSGVEWVPFTLSDTDAAANGNTASAAAVAAKAAQVGSANEKRPSFTSWRERQGLDPIVAGPHWAEVKKKLEASGLNVWWAPTTLPEQPEIPEARDAPAVGAILSEPGWGSSLHGEHEAADEEVVVRREGGGDGHIRGGVDSDNGGIGVHDAPMQPPPGMVAGAAGAAVAAEADAFAQGGGSWAPLVGFLSCVGVAGIGFMGRKRRRKLRTARRRKEVVEWSGNAFSSGPALSPLGVGMTSFDWLGGNKDHDI